MPETKQDRQMGRESRTKVSGPGAEWSGSQEPGEEADLECGSKHPAESRGGRVE